MGSLARATSLLVTMVTALSVQVDGEVLTRGLCGLGFKIFIAYFQQMFLIGSRGHHYKEGLYVRGISKINVAEVALKDFKISKVFFV